MLALLSNKTCYIEGCNIVSWVKLSQPISSCCSVILEYPWTDLTLDSRRFYPRACYDPYQSLLYFINITYHKFTLLLVLNSLTTYRFNSLDTFMSLHPC